MIHFILSTIMIYCLPIFIAKQISFYAQLVSLLLGIYVMREDPPIILPKNKVQLLLLTLSIYVRLKNATWHKVFSE